MTMELTPEKSEKLLSAMFASIHFEDEVKAMSNELLAAEISNYVSHNVSILSKEFALLDEALMRLDPPRRNGAFPPGS